MGLLGGGFLRLLQTALYALAFACSGIILGVYSYFLAVLADRDLVISKQMKAVEGISGVAVVYTIFAVVLTCCLGGISFFGFVAIVLNIAFVGGFIAIAVLTRTGAGSCDATTIVTPIGTGSPNTAGGFDNQYTYSVDYRNACELNKAAFAVSIIGAFLFLILSFVQVFLVRHHKKDKRFGPSPANNYTSGAGKRKFWQRRRKGDAVAAGANGYATRDPEMAGADIRPSHDTAYTGSTVAAPHQTGVVKDQEPVGHSSHGRYYTQPEGTGVNPYGYENTQTGPAARNF